jgi:hypothetical protein
MTELNFLVILQNKENLPIYLISNCHLSRWKWTKYSEKKHFNLRRMMKKLKKLQSTTKRSLDLEFEANFTVRGKVKERESGGLGRSRSWYNSSYITEGKRKKRRTMERRNRRKRKRKRKRKAL